jgi:hypothetical protein
MRWIYPHCGTSGVSDKTSATPLVVMHTVATTVGSGMYGLSTSAAASGYAVDIPKGGVDGAKGVSTKPTSTKVENAVYGHIRAMRALGRTRVDSLEISQALKLAHHLVEQALHNLTRKGVKIVGWVPTTC